MTKIICAAIRFPVELKSHVYKVKNTGMALVMCGHRHPHIIGQWTALTDKQLPEGAVQGFLTDQNTFLTRKEAMELFRINGQMKTGQQLFSENELFSEDLY